MSHAIPRLAVLLSLLPLSAELASAQTREAAIVHNAAVTLDEIMSIPARRIPESMLSDAQAVAIIPGVVKGSFVVGIRHGRGVVVTRDASGAWQLPIFVTLTGGSVGWQAGIQATDVIMVFKSQSSVTGLLRGKFTVGADAAAAAGPLGRQAAAATDAQLSADILSYSRSRGLFIGVSLDGSAIQTDLYANQMFYGAPLVGPDGTVTSQPMHVPIVAQQLVHKIANYTQSPEVTLTSGNAALQIGPDAGVQEETENLRTKLVNASLHLYAILDAPWQQFLALPAEVYHGNQPLHPSALQASLGRFDQIAGDMRYRGLTSRTEYQRVHKLLRQYLESQTWNNPKLSLPPPPETDTPD